MLRNGTSRGTLRRFAISCGCRHTVRAARLRERRRERGGENEDRRRDDVDGNAAPRTDERCIEDGYEHQREGGRGRETANHRNRERPFHLRPGTHAEREGK